MTFSVVTGASDTTRGGQDCAADRHDAFRDGSAQSPHMRQSSARSGPQPYPATIGPRLPPQVHLDRSPLAQAARSTNIVNLDDRLSVRARRSTHARNRTQDGVAARRQARKWEARFRWSVCDQLQFAKCIKLSPVDCRTRLWGAVRPSPAVRPSRRTVI